MAVLGTAVVILFVLINGAAAYRQAERGWTFRYGRPNVANFVELSAERVFFLQCSGSGASIEGDVVLLLDADIASSSYGWSWLTPSLSNLWRTCIFDRAGYGWSTPGAWPRTVEAEASDLFIALQAAGVGSSRFVYISHGISAWNSLLFRSLVGEQVVAMVFLDPFEPHKIVGSDSVERERLSFIENFGRAGMILNAFGVLPPFFHLIRYFAPAFNLPETILPLFVDSVSRQDFWTTIVSENDVINQSANETLSRYPLGSYALGNTPIAVWARNDTSATNATSGEYFATLSNRALMLNLSFADNHFFIFEKRFAQVIVETTSYIVRTAIRPELYE